MTYPQLLSYDVVTDSCVNNFPQLLSCSVVADSCVSELHSVVLLQCGSTTVVDHLQLSYKSLSQFTCEVFYSHNTVL